MAVARLSLIISMYRSWRGSLLRRWAVDSLWIVRFWRIRILRNLRRIWNSRSRLRSKKDDLTRAPPNSTPTSCWTTKNEKLPASTSSNNQWKTSMTSPWQYHTSRRPKKFPTWKVAGLASGSLPRRRRRNWSNQNRNTNMVKIQAYLRRRRQNRWRILCQMNILKTRRRRKNWIWMMIIRIMIT